MKFTYLMLHPCSAKNIRLIFDKIKKEQFSIEGVYRIDNWNSTIDKIYSSSYGKSNSVKEHVLAHAYINTYLFGNCGLLILLFKNEDYKTLIQDTLCLKQEIRNHMNDTREGVISISLNVNHSIYNENKLNEVRMVEVFLSYLHCPDTKEQYFEDFKNLQYYFSKGKKLSMKEINSILKYCSYNG